MRKKIFKFKIFIVLLFSFFLSSCSFFHFSAYNYTPPEGYQMEVIDLFHEIKKTIPLKHDYMLVVLEDKEAKELKGIPSISNRQIFVPENYIKYIYQNYYDDRLTIISSMLVHEMSHDEFDMPSKPVQEHYQLDRKAIALLVEHQILNPQQYYQSLGVLHDYWFARKGVMGHALNASWNLANAASSVYLGVGAFRDWFATDVKKRMKWIRKDYKIESRKRFKRSHSPKDS